jgi:hypothetical protein
MEKELIKAKRPAMAPAAPAAPVAPAAGSKPGAPARPKQQQQPKQQQPKQQQPKQRQQPGPAPRLPPPPAPPPDSAAKRAVLARPLPTPAAAAAPEPAQLAPEQLAALVGRALPGRVLSVSSAMRLCVDLGPELGAAWVALLDLQPSWGKRVRGAVQAAAAHEGADAGDLAAVGPAALGRYTRLAAAQVLVGRELLLQVRPESVDQGRLVLKELPAAVASLVARFGPAYAQPEVAAWWATQTGERWRASAEQQAAAAAALAADTKSLGVVVHAVGLELLVYVPELGTGKMSYKGERAAAPEVVEGVEAELARAQGGGGGRGGGEAGRGGMPAPASREQLEQLERALRKVAVGRTLQVRGGGAGVPGAGG